MEDYQTFFNLNFFTGTNLSIIPKIINFSKSHLSPGSSIGYKISNRAYLSSFLIESKLTWLSTLAVILERLCATASKLDLDNTKL